MNYIVFDLEWNQPYSNDISFMKRTKMPLTGEIIQIGAVKLNDKLDIVDHLRCSLNLNTCHGCISMYES